MSINTINATIQMRKGMEQDFDPDQMTAGEWAVSTDSKKVWMCFAPGLVRRMATYETFEKDMHEIQQILSDCQDIKEAAEAFERLAEKHKNDAAESASAASNSESAASISETNAAESASSAADSFQDANESAMDAKKSQDAAKLSENNAFSSASAAADSESAAEQSAQDASRSAMDANTSEKNASRSENLAKEHSLMSKSYAVGTDGETRPGDATDNAKSYSEMAKFLTAQAQKLLEQAQKLIAAISAGALLPAGTIAFEDLPQNPSIGYMYNISNDFTTDGRFVEGSGVFYRAGANVYWTVDGKWDVLVGAQVTGIKGDKESTYHVGNYNVTPAAIGALKVTAASMERHPIRDVTHVQNGRLDLDMGWNENYGTEANLSLGIRAVDADSASFKSVVTISDDSVEMKATGDNGICRMGIHWDGLLLSGSNGAHYAFPCGPGLCEIAPKDRIDITTPDEIGIVAGDHVAINAGGKVRITAQDKIHITSATEIRLIPGSQDSNAAPDPSRYVKTGNIQGIKSGDGSKPNISNFGDIRSETYNGHKVLGTNGGTMENGAMISFTDSRPNGDQYVNIDETGLEVGYDQLGTYGFDKTIIQPSGFIVAKEYSTGKQDLNTLSGEGITFHSDNGHPYSIDVYDQYSNWGGLDIYTNDLSPKIDSMSLGGMCNWDVVHANTGTIQTSDRNKKNSIAELSEQKANDFIMGLKPATYKMNNGTSGRTHWGLISQDVEELLKCLGMDSTAFAGFIKSPKVIVKTTDENDNVTEDPVREVVDGEYDYSLRYDEFVAPIIKVIQMQQAEIESLKADNAKLEARLAKIEKQLGAV